MPQKGKCTSFIDCIHQSKPNRERMDKLLQDWLNEDLLKRIWIMVATQDTCDNSKTMEETKTYLYQPTNP